MNMTLLHKVRCMLLSSGLSKLFWGETVKTPAYLINRSPKSTLNLNVPKSVWTQKHVVYSYLKIFGCAAYAYQNIGKLDPRSLKCVFLDYVENIKGYKLWVYGEKGLQGYYRERYSL